MRFKGEREFHTRTHQKPCVGRVRCELPDSVAGSGAPLIAKEHKEKGGKSREEGRREGKGKREKEKPRRKGKGTVRFHTGTAFVPLLSLGGEWF